MTAEGHIPHIVVNGYQAPVMIDVSKPKVNEYHSPLRINGALAYALPGGKFFQNKV